MVKCYLKDCSLENGGPPSTSTSKLLRRLVGQENRRLRCPITEDASQVRGNWRECQSKNQTVLTATALTYGSFYN